MTSAMRAGPLATELLQWTFADRMRKIRRDILQMDQTEFAQQLGITRQAYAAWESGRNEPRSILAIAKKVELLSGVPAAWTLGVDQPSLDTGSQTPRYQAPTSGARPRLVLVNGARPSNRPVAPSYGSSGPAAGYDPSRGGPRSTKSVNYAHPA